MQDMTTMEQRLQELRAEQERGLRQMAQLDRQRQELQHTLLRINGAIQVLDELLKLEREKTSGDGGATRVRAVGA